jgi:hypothetical protein
LLLKSQEDLSAYVLREGLDAGFDLAFSNELPIDHSITCPITTLRPEATCRSSRSTPTSSPRLCRSPSGSCSSGSPCGS